jgi:hypothetical protein
VTERKVKESAVLRALKAQARAAGFEFIRMSFRPGVAGGWPDTAIIADKGITLWVETKRPGKPLEPLQKFRAEQLLGKSHLYMKVDTIEGVAAAIEALKVAERMVA